MKFLIAILTVFGVGANLYCLFSRPWSYVLVVLACGWLALLSAFVLAFYGLAHGGW